MATIDGSSYEEMSKRMFRYAFTNELASLYSWVGGKGKLKLHYLEVMKLMLSKLNFLIYIILSLITIDVTFVHNQINYYIYRYRYYYIFTN